MAKLANSNKGIPSKQNALRLSEELSLIEFQINAPGLSRDELTLTDRKQFKRTLLHLADMLRVGVVAPVGKAHGRISLVPKKLVVRAQRERTKQL